MSDEGKKKWKPVHKICIAQLLGGVVYATEVQHWARIYMAGAIAPSKIIPDLIKAFQHAENVLKGQIKIPEIALAIASLNEQLKKGINVGDFVSFKKEVIDCGKQTADLWDALIGKTSPKDKFEVLDFDSSGNAILKGWCVISDGESTPIPIDLKVLNKVVTRKRSARPMVQNR